jgi:hypothetical protein
MRASDIWRSVTVDRSNFRDSLFDLLAGNGIRYCVIGGQGVNAYVEPLISLDLDLVVAVDQIALVESLLRSRFEVEALPHSLEISAPNSGLRVQIQTDPRYFDFVNRAQTRDVLGLQLPVADLPDILQGKIWAALDPQRRPTKRRKDLLDIERILEAFPHLREHVPAEILDRLV